MNKIVMGSLVCTAAGVVYYIFNRGQVDNQLRSLRNKASNSLDQAKSLLIGKATGVPVWALS